MKPFLRVLIAMTMTAGLVGLTGCGDSVQEKASKKVDKQINAYEKTYNELVAMGRPSGTWSTTQLDMYEAKINELESTYNKLNNANYKDGVVITGLATASLDIAQARRNLNAARAAKALVDALKGTNQAEKTARQARLARYSTLMALSHKMRDDLDKNGRPLSSWSKDSLATFIRGSAEVLTVMKDEETLLQQVWSDLADPHSNRYCLKMDKAQVEFNKVLAENYLAVKNVGR